ncbi:hypothetical protein ACVNPX_02230 [Staphylococcus aureus]
MDGPTQLESAKRCVKAQVTSANVLQNVTSIQQICKST